jgi:asparagine synthetase B (glutamine-hydrolysing)
VELTRFTAFLKSVLKTLIQSIRRTLKCAIEVLQIMVSGRTDEVSRLGAVRLAIIGLGNCHQPIPNESEDVVFVCNGEIDNYRELKDSLVEKGHRFNMDIDIEVITHLY